MKSMKIVNVSNAIYNATYRLLLTLYMQHSFCLLVHQTADQTWTGMSSNPFSEEKKKVKD